MTTDVTGSDSGVAIDNFSISASGTSCTAPTISGNPSAQTLCAGGNPSYTVTASGTTLTYQWRKNGTPISDGATGNGSTYSGATTATLTITGAQPADTAVQASGFDCVVTESGSCSSTSTKAALTVNAIPTITTPSPLPAGTVGTAYSQSLASSGGTSPYAYAVTSGSLPTGVTLSSGTLSGTPTASGTFNFTISSTDSSSTACAGSKAFSLTVNCPTTTVSPSSLPTVTIGAAYSQTVSASGGNAPYTYTITAGALPSGLSLDSSSGVISGTYSGSPDTANFTVTATGVYGCAGSRVYTVALAACSTITLSPGSPLTGGTVGSAYSGTITADGGTGPYTYSVTSGALPAGISLSSGGALSGTATASGTAVFTVLTADANGCNGTSNYSLTVSCPTVTLDVADPLPDGTGNASYSQTLTASGGTSPYTFAKTSGTLPTGVTLSSGGVLSGTPTSTGNYTFDVQATGTYGCTGTKTYHLTVNCPTITVSPSTLPDVYSGVAYSQTVSGSGDTAPYTFAVTAGALPSGLTLSSGGLISGTYSGGGGSATFTVTATSANSCTGSREYTVTLATCPTITLSPGSPLTGGTVGSAYSQTITASGGGTYSFAKTAGTLPTGVTLSSGGALSGTPTASGTYNFTVTATDTTTGCNGSQAYSVTMTCPTVTLSPGTLPNGKVNVAYSQTITASGGTAPYTYTITSGTQPTGLTLSSGGVLSGTPTTVGAYTFTVQATGANGCTGTQTYTVAIPAGSSGVVISQIYGGGGNVYDHDFIVIFNRGCSSVSVAGWSVQYASATGTSWTPTALSGSIPAGGYYLVALTATAGGTVLPTADATGSINMSATAGKAALCNSTTALSGANPSSSTIIDLVGFGSTASAFEGTGPTPAPSSTTSVQRKNTGCTDTDNNANDFAAATPIARNSATAANTCTASATVRSADSTTVCSGSSATVNADLTGVAPFTVTWSSGVTHVVAGFTDSITVTPGSTTAYTITSASDSCGAITPSGSATVTIPSTLSIDTQPANQSTCLGSSATFTVAATGAASYQWYKGTPGSGTPIAGATSASFTTNSVVADAAGSYYVEVTGCPSTQTSSAATLTVNQVTLSGLSDTTACEGSATGLSVTPSGGTPGYTYVWKKNGVVISGATSSSYPIASAALSDVAVYSVTVTDSAGCTATASATLRVNIYAKASVLSPENFGAGAIPGTWSTAGAVTWSGAAVSTSTGYADASGSGNATAAADAASQDAALITPTLNFSGLTRGVVTFGVRATATWARDVYVEASVDNGATYTIEVAHFTPATIPNDAFWYHKTLELGTGVNNQSQVKLRWRLAGTGASSANIRIDDVIVYGSQGPVAITPSASTTICSGSSVGLTASGASTYTWSPGTGLDTTMGASVTANPTITTTYTVTGTDGNGCSQTAEVTVTVNPTSVGGAATPTDAVICGGTGTTITLSGHTGSVSKWQYSSDNFASDSHDVANTTTTLNTGNLTATRYYRAVVTSGVCSSANSSAGTVTVNALPTVVITPSGSTTYCTGGSVGLTASGASTYTWSPGTGLDTTTGASVTANPTTTTTYTVTGTDGNGCQNTAQVTVTVDIPIAGPVTYFRTSGASFKDLSVVSLMTHASTPSGGSVFLNSVGPTSAHGVSVTTDGTTIFYRGALTGNDTFPYTVTNGCGTVSAAGTVSITATAATGQNATIGVNEGIVTLTFHGVPGTQYHIQRAAVNDSGFAGTLTTSEPVTADNNTGVITYTDNSAPSAGAYYRLIYP